MPRTRLWTKKTCPPRSISRRIAWRISVSSYSAMVVWIGRRSSGGVSMVLRSRTPVMLMCSVRGIGVAVSVSTSTWLRSCLMRSLCVTPKRCSSSTTSSPRSLNVTSLDSSRCVPITTSTEPSCKPRQHLVLLRGGAEAAQHLHRDRKGCQAARESLRVLLRQHGGGHQHRDLLAVHHRLERGPQRDLGLAVADIAADQAVHGPAGFHVCLDRLDGDKLVTRLLVGESRLQLRLPDAVGRKRVAFGRLARRVKLQQVGCDVVHRLARLLLDPLPVSRAQTVQNRRVMLARAHVAAQPVGLMHRHEQPVAHRVVQLQVLAHAAVVHRHFHQAHEAADAVFHVNHKVARGHIGEEGLGRAGTRPLRPPPAGFGPAKQLGVAVEMQRAGRQAAQHPALVQHPLDQPQSALGRRVQQVFFHGDGLARLFQQVGQPRRLARHQHGALPGLALLLDIGHDLLDLSAVARAGHEMARQRRGSRRSPAIQVSMAQQDRTATLQQWLELAPRQMRRQRVGRQIAAGDQVTLRLRGLRLQLRHQRHELGAVVHQQQRVVGRVVHQRRRLRVEVGNVPLLALEAGALAQLLALAFQLVARRRVHGPQVQLGQAVQRDRAVARQRLAGRADQHLLDVARLGDRSLRSRVEEAQAVHLVAKQLDAHRPEHVGRPDVHDAAAPADLPDLLDHGVGAVAQPQPAQQRLAEVQRLAGPQRTGRQPQLARRQRPLHQRARRGDYHQRRIAPVAPRQRRQRAEARLARLARPGNALVGQRVGVSQQAHCGQTAGRRQPDL